MDLKEFIRQISFKRLTGLAFVFALALMVPVSVWVVKQETKTVGQAFFEKPKPIEPERDYGSPSGGQPQITLVWPFLGKVGDAVLIYGNNFGNNPKDKLLTVGNQNVAEEKIKQWTPALIEFETPPLAPGSYSQAISLSVAGQTANWAFPFTVYDLETQTQIAKPNGSLILNQGPTEGKIEIFFDDGSQTERPALDQAEIPEGKAIVSLRVLDQNNLPLPFFVEPSEFGF